MTDYRLKTEKSKTSERKDKFTNKAKISGINETKQGLVSRNQESDGLVSENDLRRVLCYGKINQIGFMVVGIGIGTDLAIDGAIAHAFTHVIYKGLLFMSMGAVLFRTGEIRGSHLGGLYKTMPWTTGFCIVGAASISAFPLFSGFVSKSIIITEAARN